MYRRQGLFMNGLQANGSRFAEVRHIAHSKLEKCLAMPRAC